MSEADEEKEPIRVVAIYGSPRRRGNTSLLLEQAVRGARDAGAIVEEVVLRDLKISPCLEIYGCKESGRCVIRDDFQKVYDQLLACHGLILASPIFFYTVSAQTKILMDRCQSLWVKKYWIEKRLSEKSAPKRKGMFISVGATKGSRLFEGALLTVKYFLDPLDMELWQALLYRGLDFEGDVLQHPEYLEQARQTGRNLCEEIRKGLQPDH
ncbi:MAG: flavodoxin family protein [Desulfomonile tiedjei]|nr:flavodoxin family protein [Desulfomonile tiedjei]